MHVAACVCVYVQEEGRQTKRSVCPCVEDVVLLSISKQNTELKQRTRTKTKTKTKTENTKEVTYSDTDIV